MQLPILVTKNYDIMLSEAEDIFYDDDSSELTINYRGDRGAENCIYLKKNEVENNADNVRKLIHKATLAGEIFVDIRGFEK